MHRILSVSYDALLLRTRQMILESRGYEVVSAEGFTEAMEKCSSGKYDLLIIGHSLPHKDKQVLLREFRRCCPGPALVLLRTGETPLTDAAASIESHEPELVLTAVEHLFASPTGAQVTSRFQADPTAKRDAF